jgi:uncharacterized membrane protein (DUF106 family)
MGMLDSLNGRLSAVGDVVLTPLDRISPAVSVVISSIAVAVLILLAFRYASDQHRIARAKRQMQAYLFEIRLFNDDPRAILRAQGGIMAATAAYLRLSLVPLVWLVIPFIVITAHLQGRYGYASVRPGRSALVKVRMKPQSTGDVRSLSLQVPPGVRVDSPMLWIPSDREADWRVAADRSGVYQLEVVAHGERVSKTFDVSSEVRQRSPVRFESGILNQLLYPIEPSIPPDSAISSIEVSYEPAYVGVAGLRLHWLVLFFLASFAAAFALRRPFNVTF